MAFPVYSVRFLRHSGAGATYKYRVPEDKRAVMTDVVILFAGPAPSRLYIGVDQIIAWGLTSQVQFQSETIRTRIVAYAGEELVFISEGADTRYIVSGYLFEDPADRLRDRIDIPQPVLEVAGGAQDQHAA